MSKFSCCSSRSPAYAKVFSIVSKSGRKTLVSRTSISLHFEFENISVAARTMLFWSEKCSRKHSFPFLNYYPECLKTSRSPAEIEKCTNCWSTKCPLQVKFSAECCVVLYPGVSCLKFIWEGIETNRRKWKRPNTTRRNQIDSQLMKCKDLPLSE